MRLYRRLAPICLFLLAFSPAAAGGQECPEGRISYIFIDNNSIFELSELDPDASFRWAYRLANKLHVRTREEFIMDELLFAVGDCVDTLLMSETERLLRAYRFIGDADVFAVPQPDGDQHVNVFTRDEWTTKVDFGFRIDEGLKIEGLEVTEENFLGRGVLLKGFLKKDKEVQDLGIELETPRIGGTRWDARLSMGTTRTGNFFEESLGYPFLGEVGRVGARQSFLWRETVFSYSTNGHPEYSHLLLPFLDQRWDVALGTRLGKPGDLFILGAGISRESIEFRDLPTSLEFVVDKDFANPAPVDSAGFAEVQGQTISRRANRVNVFLGKRNISFVQRRGIDAIRGIQDVAVGAEAFIGLGRAWRGLKEGGGISADDLHTQASLFLGGAWDGWILNAQAASEARHVRTKGVDDWEWKDIFAEADLLLYWQPPGAQRHTLLFRASAAGGWSVETPFQLTLGGRASLRGYREEAYPGAKRILLTLEDRLSLSSPAPGLFDLGLAFFLDVGRMGAGDVPFGVDSGWIGTVGGGLRFGLPPATENVIRIDLALPLKTRTQLKDLILRVNLRELLGILPGSTDRQLLRSRRSGVRPTFVTIPW
ncbi:MAG: hypothetical protein PVJ76_04325 [Gemmatimonadota bacterium]|jgi:hypothetical protein